MTARWHIEPIGMDDAARAIGVCRRLLSDILARHPHYETRGRTGRKKVFYPEHIDRIREALRCEKTGNPNSTPNTDGRSNSRSKAGEFAAALASVTAASRTSRAARPRRSIARNGNAR